ncbi:AraC family transcriptional regulator ligand-binding domain-containing protein [Streptomyces sp. NRRL F-2664]|uniref:AraC family transcriptional regulator ligand-binding domain-containing protein n=1 Tax=Streptomyces sp. NRRL F-2664 TaxID=1463842 RepID=UPI000691DA0A|nr:AraC family transcriptional regulator ligand-binding domain-containing protein [Streptomyces sp. NRRL F-2664]
MQSHHAHGTVSVHLARFIVDALRRSGAGVDRFARFHDLGPEVLANDLARVSTPSALAVWEELTVTEAGTAVGALLAAEAPIGAFGLWDYLVTSGPTLRESLKQVVEYNAVVADPANERLLVEEDGHTFTVRHATGRWGPDVVAAIDWFALAMFLTRARAATGRPLVPLRVSVTHGAPRQYRRLAELFGTTRIDFEAPYNSITFRDDDVRAPLPKAQPGLDRLLAQQARMTLAAAQPVMLWQDSFRMVLAGAFREDQVSLEYVAGRLAMSPRTLQRRLRELGTTWREEVESVRQERTMELLRTTDLPLQLIAARVGYSDLRALRRAVRRWDGRAPRDIRNAAGVPAPAAGG